MVVRDGSGFVEAVCFALVAFRWQCSLNAVVVGVGEDH